MDLAHAIPDERASQSLLICIISILQSLLIVLNSVFVVFAVLSNVDCSERIDICRLPAARATVSPLYILRQLFLCFR